MSAVLDDMVGSGSHAHEIPILRRKAKIYGRECVYSPDRALRKYPSQEIALILKNTLEQIKQIFGEEADKINALLGENADEITINFNYDDLAIAALDTTNLGAPLQRVTSKFALVFRYLCQ